MAVRIQLRRDTASNWSTNNPILRPGEIGIETDTLKFKIGPAVESPAIGTAWNSISNYANVTPSGLSNSLNEYILAANQGTPGGPAELNSNGDLVIPEDQIVLWNDLLYSYTTTLTATEPTADRTITIPDASGTIALTSDLVTTNVSEGTNLYFTNARAQDAAASLFTSGSHNGINFSYDDDNNVITATVTGAAVPTFTTGIVFEGSIADGNETTFEVEEPTGDRTITFKDESGTVAYTSDIVSAIDFLTTSDIEEGTNLYFTNTRARATVSGGTGLDYNSTTGVFDIDSTVTTNSGEQELTNKTLTSPKINENITLTATATELNILDGATLSTAELNILDGVTATAVEINTLDGITANTSELNILDGATLSTTELNYVDGVTSAIQTQLDGKQDIVSGVSSTEIGYLDGVTSSIQTQIDAKAPLASPTFTGTTNAEDLIISGDLTVSGTTTTVSTEDLVVSDPLIYIGEGNAANLVDLGLVASFDDGTYQHSGLVRDSSAGTWKLFKGVTDEPTTTVNFAQGSLDALAVSALSAEDITSIDATFTGTVTLPAGTVTSAMIADGTIVNADINASAAIALSKLATDPLARANHTGTQTASTISDFNEAAQDAVGGILGSGLTYTDASNTITVDSTVVQLRVSGVSDTEIGYLDGITSNVQAQLDSKISASSSETLTNKTINLANNTISGTIAQFNTALSDADFSTISGAETLSNKTLSNVILNGTITADSSVGSSGQYLESTGTGVRWTSVSGYSAPTLGSTSIASGATVTTISALTLSNAALSGTLTAGGVAGSNGQVLQSTGTGVTWATVSSGTSLTIENNGSAMTVRPNLNLIGFSVTDDSVNTETDVVNYAGLAYAAAAFR